REATSLQLPHGAAVHEQAGKGPQVAGPRLQARRYRGRATRVHAALGPLHEAEPVTPAAHRNIAMSNAKLSAVDDRLFVEIQRFLFREAGLLDRRDYGAWLTLATDDIQYRVTAATTRDAGASAADYAIIDENLTGLKSRIDQISNPRLTRA